MTWRVQGVPLDYSREQLRRALAAEEWEVEVIGACQGTYGEAKTWKVMADKGAKPPRCAAIRGKLLVVRKHEAGAPPDRKELDPKKQRGPAQKSKPRWLPGWEPTRPPR